MMDEQARSPFKDIYIKDLMNDRLDVIQAKMSVDYYKENKRDYKPCTGLTNQYYNRADRQHTNR